jgi:hypothetical protein
MVVVLPQLELLELLELQTLEVVGVVAYMMVIIGPLVLVAQVL